MFGKPRDPVAAQLRELERQGHILSSIAHFCSFLLIITFSLGSLVALSTTALNRFMSAPNPSDGISLLVSLILIVCMDLGMLYGARMLRILSTRGADRKEKLPHAAMVVTACLLEAATYAYLGYTLDRPDNVVVWFLVGLRALGSPVFAVYLSLAHTLPVTPRDILHHVEVGAGTELIRDATRMAQDPKVTMGRKAEVFRAAALMQPSDRERLDQVVGVLSPPTGPAKRAPRKKMPANVSPLDTAHNRVAALLRANPTMGVTELARRAQVSRSTAKRHRRQLVAA